MMLKINLGKAVFLGIYSIYHKLLGAARPPDPRRNENTHICFETQHALHTEEALKGILVCILKAQRSWAFAVLF